MKNFSRLSILFLAIFPALLFGQGQKFRPPALNNHTKALIQNVSTGIPAERMRAIAECGHSRILVCYYPLVNVLSDPDPKIRGAAASSLGLLRLKESLDPLATALKSEEDIGVKESILFAFGLLRDHRGGPIVVEYLGNSDPKIRRAAAISLTMIRSPETKNAIMDALKAENVDTIQIELIYGALLLDPENTELTRDLIANLFHTDRLVRFSAAKAARELKIKETLVPLQKAIQFETDELVRAALLDAYQEVLYE